MKAALYGEYNWRARDGSEFCIGFAEFVRAV